MLISLTIRCFYFFLFKPHFVWGMFVKYVSRFRTLVAMFYEVSLTHYTFIKLQRSSLGNNSWDENVSKQQETLFTSLYLKSFRLNSKFHRDFYFYLFSPPLCHLFFVGSWKCYKNKWKYVLALVSSPINQCSHMNCGDYLTIGFFSFQEPLWSILLGKLKQMI